MVAILTGVAVFIDTALMRIIAAPILFCMYSRFFPPKPASRFSKVLLFISKILVLLFFTKCFLSGFIFTEANAYRFASSEWRPLIDAIFYN